MSDPPTSPPQAPFDLQAVVDHAPRPLLLLDSQGTITWSNRAAGDLAGLDPQAIVGHSILEFIVDDDVALVLESMEYLLDRPGRFRPMEFRYRRPDGSTGVIEAVSSNQLRDETVNGIVVQVHDITERRIIDQVLESIASGATFAATMRLIARLVEEQLEGTRAIIGVDPVDGRFRSAISVFDLVDELAGAEALGEPVEPIAPTEPAEGDAPAEDERTRAGGPVGPGDPHPHHRHRVEPRRDPAGAARRGPPAGLLRLLGDPDPVADLG